MKKILSMLLVLSMLLGCSVAMAMEVQVIGGPDTETEPVSLDDIQLNAEADIEGYGTLFPTEFAFADWLGYYKAGKTEVDWYNFQYQSGQDAEYAILRMDITNTSTKPRDFLTNCEVKMVYDDLYEYAGWFYQVNYNNATYNDNGRFGVDSKQQNYRWAINAADNFAIDPMYQGHYIFGCTVPNAVVNGKKPLRLVITIDGNEITYNVRK